MVLWIIARITWTFFLWAYFILRVGFTRDEDKQEGLFLEFATLGMDTLAALPTVVAEEWQHDPRPKRRAQALLSESWLYDMRATSLMAGGGEVHDFLGEGVPARALEYAKKAVECYESGLQILRQRETTGFLSGMKHRDRAARHALLYAHLAAAYLRFDNGDLTESLEIALAQYESALAIAKDAGLPELSGWILAQVGSACLVYPTEHEDRYVRKAIVALEDAQKAFAPYAPALLRLKDDFGSGSWTSLAIFSWTLLPKLLKARWRGSIPRTLPLDLINPSYMARLHTGLGVAYSRVGELGKALQQFDRAQAFLPEDFDEEQIAIEVSKGLAYLSSRHGDRLENLKLGLQSLGIGLEQSGKKSRRAIAALHYARGCLERDALDKPDPGRLEKNLEIHTKNLRFVARIARRLDMDAVRREALVLLGSIYALRDDLKRAYQALALAARAAERLHASARTPRFKSYVIGRGVQIYEPLLRASFAYIARLGSDARLECKRDMIARCALALAERGKTRFLQEQLVSCNLLPRGAKPEELEELFRLRRLWVGAELKLLELESGSYGNEGAELTGSIQSRRNAIERAYGAALVRVREQFNDPAYDPDRPVIPVRFAEISTMLQTLSAMKETALVEYYITDEQLLVFVLLPSRAAVTPKLAFLDTRISREEIDELERRWREGLDGLRSIEQPIHHVQWTNGYLSQTLNGLSRAVTAPWEVLKGWEQQTGRHIARVIVIPHRFLHLVPLHAVPLPDGRMWGEAASIQYAPSVSVLWRLAHMREDSGDQIAEPQSPLTRKKVLAVAYSPDTSGTSTRERQLLFHVCEARAVAESTGGDLLEGPGATLSRVLGAMQDATYVHVACHGVFDQKAPLESGLELAPDGKVRTTEEVGREGSVRLTLREIFERVHLPCAHLVVLSACETGIPKTEGSRDEYIGLPAGFLFAGAKTVVSTLWPVNDVATWLLMREMARRLAGGVGPPDALRLAQHSLRHFGPYQVAEEITRAAEKEDNPERREHMVEESQRLRERAKSEPYCFASPYWWAGFTVNGLG